MASIISNLKAGPKNLLRALVNYFLNPGQIHNALENYRYVKALIFINVEKITNKNTSIDFIAPDIKSIGDLRVCSILDEFSEEGFSKEVSLINLVSGSSLEQLENHKPHLLFVESAWFGENKSWSGRLVKRDHELQKIIRWCRKNNVPTVFWNKEDPVHFKSFLITAKDFDYLFTTDSDSESKYKRHVQSKVGTLSFGVSTKSVTPFDGKTERVKRAIFAGSYYSQYKQRQQDIRNVLSGVEATLPIDIYDRNLISVKGNSAFPEELLDNVQPAVHFSEILLKYKNYLLAVTINTVKQSNSMFARRALEAVASNSILVSNESIALRRIFKQSIIMSDEKDKITRLTSQVIDDLALQQEIRISSLIKVLESETLHSRVHHLAGSLFHASSTENYEIGTDSVFSLSVQISSGLTTKIKARVKLSEKGIITVFFDEEGDSHLADTSDSIIFELVRLGTLVKYHYQDLGLLTFNFVDVKGHKQMMTMKYQGDDCIREETISTFAI